MSISTEIQFDFLSINISRQFFIIKYKKFELKQIKTQKKKKNTMQHLYINNNSQLCLLSKHTSKCVGIETSNMTLKANFPPAYVEIKTQLQNSQRTEKPQYTLKLRIVNRDQEKSEFIVQGSKVHLINALTQQFIICTSTGDIKFDKKSTYSDDNNKHLFKASTWTVQFFKNQNKVIQSGKDILTIYDDLCFKSVHSTYLTLKSNLQLTASTEVDEQKSVWNLIKANVPYIPEWVFRRNSFNKFSKLNFGQNENLNPNNLREKKMLKSFPPQIQQSLLVQDILDIMLGFQGVYIKRRKQKNQFAIEPYLQQPSCNIALSQLVYKILALPALEIKVESYISTYSIHEGVVCQALCGGLRKLIKEYKMMVIQFDQLAKESLTLQKLWYLSQSSLKVMQALSNLVDQAQKYRGGQLITCVTKLLNENTDKQIIQIYTFIFQNIMQVYVQMLSKWLYQGIIEDKYQQFMIMNEAKNFNKEWNYWEQKFLIRENQIPSIFAKQANEILVTGKYLNILKVCQKLHDHPYNQEIFQNFQKFVQMQNFSDPITRAYEWANNQMLKLVFEDYKFNNVLNSIKGYYFLQFGDLFVHFMDVAEQDLSIPKKKFQGMKAKQFSEEKVQNLFELLLRTSSANNDEFKDEVSCRVQNSSLYDQMHRIKTLQPQKLNYDFIEKPYVKKDSKYIDYLTLDYKSKFPLTLIFNKKNMSKYQILFRFLFWCKYTQRQLNNTWLCLQSTKQISIPYYTPAYLLNQKMIHFIKNFIHYLCYEVIQQNWEIFHQNLKKVKTFEDIIKCHNNFLDRCLVESLLSNSGLLQLITAQLGKALEGFTAIRRLINKLIDQYNFQNQILPMNKGGSILTQRKVFIRKQKQQFKISLQQRQFKALVEGYSANFDDNLKKILREIYLLVLKQDNNMLNLLNRLDQERYYNRKFFGNENQIYIEQNI